MSLSHPKLTGVSTEVWGPKAWGVLHAIGFSYPTTPTFVEKESAYRLLLSLGHLLPCKKCRRHYLDQFNGPSGISSSDSRHLESGDSLSHWLVDLHNEVNIRLGKPVVPYAEVSTLYSGDYICPPDPTVHPRGSLMGDLCHVDDLPHPENTLEQGLPMYMRGCFSGIPGGNTGFATVLVLTALFLITLSFARLSPIRKHLIGIPSQSRRV